jgi:hypothetical protein
MIIIARTDFLTADKRLLKVCLLKILNTDAVFIFEKVFIITDRMINNTVIAIISSVKENGNNPVKRLYGLMTVV